MTAELVPMERVERAIVVIRRHRVLLDVDLAELYGVSVRALNQAVRRNVERFPRDFMFQLTLEEAQRSRSQTVILNVDVLGTRQQSGRSEGAERGRNLKYLPYAFTEQGVAMLSSVLRSARAIQVNIEIMRAFVRLRELLQSNSDLARRLDALEQKYDGQFRIVFEAIRELMEPPSHDERQIGFRPDR